MSKHYIEGTVRFGRSGPVKSKVSVASAAMPNFILCKDCNRYIPRTAFEEHCAAQHCIKPTGAPSATPDSQ